MPQPPVPIEKQCGAKTNAGHLCTRPKAKGKKYCHLHLGKNAQRTGSKGGVATAKNWEFHKKRAAQVPFTDWKTFKIWCRSWCQEIAEDTTLNTHSRHMLLMGWGKLFVKCLEAEDKRRGIGTEVTVQILDWKKPEK